jgi:hypothetical protein
VEWDDTTNKESHMKRIALIAAAVLAVPAVFAQAYGSSTTAPTTATTPMPAGAATSPMPAGAAASTDASVGSGGVVAPASASTSSNTTVSTVPMKSPHLMPGGSMVQHSSNTTTMGSGPGSTQTVTTTYWANVPSGVDRRKDFQRWMALK